MKSIALTARRKLELLDVPKPDLSNNDDVLLNVCSVGICGSDIHYYLEGGIGDTVVEYPFVIGHECVAVVDKTGDSVDHLNKGDIVVVDPAISCGQCRQCKLGRLHTCKNLRFMGIYRFTGKVLLQNQSENSYQSCYAR